MKTLKTAVLPLLALLLPTLSFSQSFESALQRISKEIEAKQNEVKARIAASKAGAQSQDSRNCSMDCISPELAKQLMDSITTSGTKDEKEWGVFYKLEKNLKLKGNGGYTHILATYNRCRQKDGSLSLCENAFVPVMVWFTYKSKATGATGSATVSVGLWEDGSVRFKAADYEGHADSALPSKDTVISFLEGAVKQLQN